MGELIDERVGFRFIEVHAGRYVIPCLCLDYSSEESAYSVISEFNNFFVSGGRISDISVRFVAARKDSEYSLYIKAPFGTESIVIEILGIDSCHIEKLKQLIEKVKYFLIIAGYTLDNRFSAIPFNEFTIAKQSFELDGRVIKAAHRDGLDWNVIIGGSNLV